MTKEIDFPEKYYFIKAKMSTVIGEKIVECYTVKLD